MIADLLKSFKHKAGAWQSQTKADNILTKLKPLLNKEEYTELSIAHNHYLNGEGAAELYDICRKLITKYDGK